MADGPTTYNTSPADSLLALNAPHASPTFTYTVGGITKAAINLGNVDNAADSAKPISTAMQATPNLKANSEADVDAKITVKQDALFVSSPIGVLPLRPAGSTQKGVAITDPLTLTSRTSALTIGVTALTKASVGLGAADDPADSAKIVSGPH
jgi:hypothetical protein